MNEMSKNISGTSVGRRQGFLILFSVENKE